MRRWNGIVGGYLAQCEARGVSEETVKARRGKLDRLNLEDWRREENDCPRICIHLAAQDLRKVAASPISGPAT